MSSRDTQKTRVVKMKRTRGKVVQGCDVYIGRWCNRGGWNLDTSKWANPFTIKKYGSRQRVLEEYEKYLFENDHLIASLHELKGKTLGCWCKPFPCHGDVLIKLIEQMEDVKST